MADNLDDYDFILLAGEQTIMAHSAVIRPFLDSCVDLRVQATANDILQAALENRVFIFVAKKDTVDGPDVHMVVVTEPCPYPQLPTLNIVSVAGTNLRHGLRKYLPKLENWASVIGFKAVESYLSDERLESLMAEHGYSRKSIHVRKLISGN